MIKQLPLLAMHGFFGTMVLLIVGLRFHAKAHATNTDQPIAQFSHEVHVGKNKIACSTCHEYTNLADDKLARRPGIPTIQKCMECHEANRSEPGFATDAKFAGRRILIDKFDKRQDIEWNRIHALPGHVYFPHHRHIRALSAKWNLKLFNTDEAGYIKRVNGVADGNREDQAKLCATCHGDVMFMSKIRQVRTLSMGWCVSCHRENGASIDCLTCHQ